MKDYEKELEKAKDRLKKAKKSRLLGVEAMRG